jgi:hypothetical protein
MTPLMAYVKARIDTLEPPLGIRVTNNFIDGDSASGINITALADAGVSVIDNVCLHRTGHGIEIRPKSLRLRLRLARWAIARRVSVWRFRQ